MISLHKKSQEPNIIAPRPIRIKFNCRRINSKKAQPSLFIIIFLNRPRRLQQCHGELKGLVMPSETSLTKRSVLHLHQAANSTSLEPSDHSTSSQAKISFMGFFYLSIVQVYFVCSFEFLGTCCLGFDSELIIGMFV
jgi:hypothetical protein